MAVDKEIKNAFTVLAFAAFFIVVIGLLGSLGASQVYQAEDNVTDSVKYTDGNTSAGYSDRFTAMQTRNDDTVALYGKITLAAQSIIGIVAFVVILNALGSLPMFGGGRGKGKNSPF